MLTNTGSGHNVFNGAHHDAQRADADQQRSDVASAEHQQHWVLSVPGRVVISGLHRDVVYLGWPIAPSYRSPNAGGVAGSRPMTAVRIEPSGGYRHRTSAKILVISCSQSAWCVRKKVREIIYRITKLRERIPDLNFCHPRSEFFPSRNRISEFQYFNQCCDSEMFIPDP